MTSQPRVPFLLKPVIIVPLLVAVFTIIPLVQIYTLGVLTVHWNQLTAEMPPEFWVGLVVFYLGSFGMLGAAVFTAVNRWKLWKLGKNS